MKLKTLRLLPLLLALCLALAACGSGDSKAGVDPAKTAQALLDSGAFAGALDTMDTETACQLYGIDYGDVTDGIVYGSLSSGAEEIAIFRMKSTDAAQAALSGLEQPGGGSARRPEGLHARGGGQAGRGHCDPIGRLRHPGGGRGPGFGPKNAGRTITFPSEKGSGRNRPLPFLFFCLYKTTFPALS